jgi:hypothetical protein
MSDKPVIDAEFEVISLDDQGLVEKPRDPSTTGPKPGNKKKLKAVEVYGYEVGRGLNKRVIVPDEVYKLAAIGCSDSEIARWFTMKETTLKDNFREIITKGREDMKQTLRQAQIRLALSGNATMLIWLGKNILGQQETPTNSQDKPILPWTDTEDEDEDTPNAE